MDQLSTEDSMFANFHRSQVLLMLISLIFKKTNHFSMPFQGTTNYLSSGKKITVLFTGARSKPLNFETVAKITKSEQLCYVGLEVS